ncbi:hypothetical protein [Enemella sp. A6]|uniref:hypothetical protein n=1 Tax=Enemella sp. A6 TaxID=3440152 RepID=UPI003EBC1374
MRLSRPVSRSSGCDHDPSRVWSHSWTDDGRRLCWQPDLEGRFAVDVERNTQPVPASLAARFGLEPASFWVAWTRAEVVAKLRDQPILALVNNEGLSPRLPKNAQLRTESVGDITFSYGVAAIPEIPSGRNS